MTNEKQKGFIVYGDIKASVDELSDEQAGRLFRGMIEYFVDGTEPEFSDVLKFVFIPIRQQMDRDSDKYVSVCDRNRKNARKRWDAVGCDRMRADAVAYGRMRSDAVDANTNTNTNTNKDTNTNTESHEQGDEISSLLLYLNEETGSNYSETEQIRELIGSKLEEGYTAEDIRTVIHNKNLEWNCSGKMRTYLRPSTLFGDKFEEYLNGPVSGEVSTGMEKESKAERLRTELEQNVHLLEQKQNRMNQIESEGVNDQNRNEIETLRFEVAHLEDVIQNLNRRLNKNET